MSKSPPRIFHDKEKYMKNKYVSYPIELFAAINRKFNGNEAKILLTFLGCAGDGSFAPNLAYIEKMTGITMSSNYYRVKKTLIDRGYLKLDKEGDIHVEIDLILEKK